MRIIEVFLRKIDGFLNSITMYRLVLYYLLVLLGWAAFLSVLGFLSFGVISLIFSTIFLVVVAWVTNKVFAYVFKVPTNLESIYISALILSLIISPIKDLHALPLLFWAAVWTAASKFIFAINKKHLFNPAAMGVFVVGLGMAGAASWWVGTAYMMPVVLAGGLLIVKKIRRWDLVLTFLAVAIGVISLLSFTSGSLSVWLINNMFLDSPILFFAFVMLTEPLTTPPAKSYRMAYGAMTGFLFAPQLHLGSLYTTPEMALCIGNIFSYFVSPKEKLILKLRQKIQLAPNIYDFVFGLNQKLAYEPGQYMEWTLGYKNPDSRGNRRYFTMASSPAESNLRIGVRFNDPSSKYKRALDNLKSGDEIIASSLSGEFTLPKDLSQKLVFIAGGIGVTPFRSIIKNMIDKSQKRDIALFYSVGNIADAVYLDVFGKAQNLGVRTIVTLTDGKNIPSDWRGKVGMVNREMIEAEVPDYKSRLFYLSGPHGMVAGFKKTLLQMGLGKSQIKTDYFPGYT